MDENKKRALRSWCAVSALLGLCGGLAILQYRWIGEVSAAERDRLRGSLQASLARISRAFNAEITAACVALLPPNVPPDGEIKEEEYATRYAAWKTTGRHGPVFQRIGIAFGTAEKLSLRILDPEKGVFVSSEWPASWEVLAMRLQSRMAHEGRPGHRPPGPPDGEGLVFAIPRFRRPPGGPPEPWQGPRELGWLVVELNPEYLREAMLPDLVQHYLGAGGAADYEVEVVNRFAPSSLVWESRPGQAKYIAASPDASVNLLELQYDQIMGRPGPPGMRERRPPREAGEDQGRWQMLVRHRAGSLEAAVARARRGNLAITGAILLLIMATAAALVRFTRNAQKLAALQMEFVAGVSHELRTPLSVLRTAGYNLRGRVASNPSQVERYGALIQQESERLTALVEQVLRFAGVNAGRVIHTPEPLSIEEVIEQSLESSRSLIEGAHCVVEKSVAPALPVVLGDPTALKHALQNLLGNAAKYGTEGSSWIGLSAAAVNSNGRQEIEIRVTDRGPGIPGDEQSRIFEPFFRGRRALEEQVHGTGLGLSLVKRIVEAHGGTVAVYSEPAKGAEFVIRIPAAPPEYQHEFTDPVSRG